MENPIVMEVSVFNNLPSKLTFLAKGLQSEHQADTEPLYIECYRKNNLNTIKLSTSTGIWTELNTYDKEDGKILPFSVAVNLYDFFNAVDQCVDELIAFWIDEDSNELVLNSFYSETKEIHELEVRFALVDQKFPKRELNLVQDAKLLNTISLDQMSLMSILSELNFENSVDGVNFVVTNGKLQFQSVYGGLKSIISIKQYDHEIYPNDSSVFIPFNVFNLMISTGQPSDIVFDVYDNKTVTVKADEYYFIYTDTSTHDVITCDDTDFVDYFIIDVKTLESNMKLLNKLTQQASVVNMEFEKVDEKLADITCKIGDRLIVSMRTDLAMLTNGIMCVDANIFGEMVSRTNIDAIKVKVNADDGVYISYENRMIRKQMQYDHSDFCKFRYYSEHK